ncbi:MAG: hypothetical protein ACTSUF_03385 [Candidatus Heimdallarchaeaceae archaeon]
MKTIILNLGDGTAEGQYLIRTIYTEQQLQKIIDKTKNQFFKEGFEDWTYDNLIDRLEKIGVLKALEYGGSYNLYA